MSIKASLGPALASLLLLVAAVPASAEPTYAQSYGTDRAEIEDLMARYLFAIDYFDWDAYVATFAEGIGRFYHTEDGQPAKLRHIVLQTVIRVEGDRAWGRSQWLEMANHGPGDEPKIGTYGIYEDEFIKVGGRWLIARRNVLNEFIPNRSSGPENPVAEMDALAEAAK